MNSLLHQSINSGNMDAALNSLKKNPVQFLLNRRLNIPTEIGNNPQAIVEHLVNTGQVPQQRVEQLKQMFGV